MVGHVAPNPASPDDNAKTNQNIDNNNNNTLAGPNTPPPYQPNPVNPAGQPAPHQLPSIQPALANPVGLNMPVPNPHQPFPIQPVPQIIHQQMINWCHFKPEFTGKPEEDAEAHLLRTNDWMRTHNFEEDVKV